MRASPLATFWIGLASAVSAFGQVTVDVQLDQNQFMPDEALIAKVRVTNFSGRTLRLGEDQSWLSFDVEGEHGKIVTRWKAPPVKGAFTLDSSEIGTKKVDLAPCFDLTLPGHYRLTATVQIPQLRMTLRSAPAEFDIIRGAVLWELPFGLPPPPGAKVAPLEIRKYALLQANHLRTLQLYFRVANETGTVTYKIYPVGRMLSFSQPEPQVDKQSRLHVLYQDGARSFKYFVFDPDGKMLVRQTYYYTATRPMLRPSADGQIKVQGGVQYPNSTDLPQPAPAVSSANEKGPKP